MSGIKKRIEAEVKSVLTFIYNEVKDCIILLCKPKSWWIFLPAILAIGSVYFCNSVNLHAYLVKGNQENAAYFLLGITIILMIYSIIENRDITSVFLCILAINFFIRELDAETLNISGYGEVKLHTKGYIYMALAVMGIWALFIREKLIAVFNEFKILKTFFLCMLFSYVFSQAIARRLFKHIPILPYEHKFHIIMEEVTENFAHFSFIMLAAVLIILKRQRRRQINTQRS